MESLCAVNPLDQFFIDVEIMQALFYEFEGLEGKQESLNEDLFSGFEEEKKGKKEKKPKVSKEQSMEVSNCIKRGVHLNGSLREMLEAKKFERRVTQQNKVNKNAFKMSTLFSQHELEGF